MKFSNAQNNSVPAYPLPFGSVFTISPLRSPLIPWAFDRKILSAFSLLQQRVFFFLFFSSFFFFFFLFFFLLFLVRNSPKRACLHLFYASSPLLPPFLLEPMIAFLICSPHCVPFSLRAHTGLVLFSPSGCFCPASSSPLKLGRHEARP